MMYTVVKDSDDVRTITLLTEVIQFSNYEEVFNKIKNSIGDYNCLIVLDLSRVKFMDSLSLGMLVPLLLFTRRLGGDMYLVAVDPKIKELFKMLRLDRVLSIYDDAAQAVAAIREEAYREDGGSIPDGGPDES